MIRLSVMYPRSDGTTFDMDYYKSKHTEIVLRTLRPVKWEIDDGIDGPYVAIGHLYFESMDTMGTAMSNGVEATGDVTNFTDVEPAFQISEVVT
jgi:uncharacterized protein (TIGR02118 family)